MHPCLSYLTTNNVAGSELTATLGGVLLAFKQRSPQNTDKDPS